MKKRVDFRVLASKIMFGKFTDADMSEMVFRKNKSIDDIDKAVQKACKRGCGKAEYEIGFLELYLADVFKVYIKGEG